MSDDKLPEEIEICNRLLNGLPCRGLVFRSGSPEVARCTACGKTGGGVRYTRVVADTVTTGTVDVTLGSTEAR